MIVRCERESWRVRVLSRLTVGWKRKEGGPRECPNCWMVRLKIGRQWMGRGRSSGVPGQTTYPSLRDP